MEGIIYIGDLGFPQEYVISSNHAFKFQYLDINQEYHFVIGTWNKLNEEQQNLLKGEAKKEWEHNFEHYKNVVYPLLTHKLNPEDYYKKDNKNKLQKSKEKYDKFIREEFDTLDHNSHIYKMFLPYKAIYNIMYAQLEDMMKEDNKKEVTIIEQIRHFSEVNHCTDITVEMNENQRIQLDREITSGTFFGDRVIVRFDNMELTIRIIANEDIKDGWKIYSTPTEDSKYYTPELEEFHIGFEYEHMIHENCSANSNPKWIKIIADTTELSLYVEGFLESKQIRVKYLDKDDLKDLGWENIRDVKSWGDKPPMYFWGASYKNAMLGYNPNDHSLAITFMDPTKSIDGKQDEYNYPETKDGQFRGICKNKSELKKLMNQLNIK